MGRVKDMYELMDECRDISRYMSFDEVVKLDREGILDTMLCDDNYSYEEDYSNYQAY